MDSSALLSSRDAASSSDYSAQLNDDVPPPFSSRRRLWIATGVIILLAFIACVVIYFVYPSTPDAPPPPPPSPPSPTPIVTVAQGQLQGRLLEESGVYYFGAIPFAFPPTGSLRWLPPEPPAAWSGVRNASGRSPACAQGSPVRGQEDCLFLNVWTQKVDREGLLPAPVLVFIHGGSSLDGDNNEDHQWLVADRDVVAVSIAYRVGVFGYMALEELTEHTGALLGRNTSGNYGLLDNMAALKWIRENIQSFGGDSTSITIYGQRSTPLPTLSPSTRHA